VIIRVATALDADADTVWLLVRQPSTLVYVMRGMLGLSSPDVLPGRWSEGATVTARLLLLDLVPAWRHEIQITAYSDARREIETAEHGGPLRVWNHRLRVEPTARDQCRYVDEVEIGAGLLTPVFWLTAWAFFRYRQWRLRKLVRAEQKEAAGPSR
jgi:hypothetical protein